MPKYTALFSILVAFVGGLAIGNLTSGGSSHVDEASEVRLEGATGPVAAAPSAGDLERYNVPVTDAQPSKGPADALVTIVEWSEFQCPFCSRVGPTVSQIMNEYEGRVRFVWRNQPLPFHDNAGAAAALAMEAFAQGGNEKFWPLHDLLFENQRALGRADLERYAQQVGLDMTRVRAALDNNTHQEAIQADSQLGASLGANGTPSFFINGRPLTGAQPFEAFKAVIDDEIQRAEAAIAAGTPRARVYAALVAGRPQTKQAPAQAPAKAPEQARPQPDPAAVYRVPVGNEPSRGPADALVTIVEVSDFECPFCGRVEPTINQILERYGADVRVVWMNNPLPFHQNAGPAANAALEAYEQGGNEKFWAMHAKLFENQRALGRENLESYAQELGLNMAQFRAALDNNEHQAAIQQQQQLAASLGARGTPSFFINGRNLRGAQPLAAFTAVIDEEMTKARALVAAGTPRSGVYAATIRAGATSPQMLAAPAGAPAAPAAPAQPPPDQVYQIAPPANAPFKGGANASVIIQEFSDFQCPFCSRVNPTISQILQEYGDRVKIIWRNYPLPFHQEAGPAAQASLEVFRQGGNEKFWAFHDLLFQNQRALGRAELESYAEQVGGINMGEFRAALDSNRHQAAVQADMDAVQRAGARIGTPSFFINGRLIQGAQPFKTAIDRALAEAR
ncbi:MAG: thioredoxin domain-containing protein [Myxococcales bacterium]|nr:thioredoxin domain-containing protein [Myxococcales bacterium]